MLNMKIKHEYSQILLCILVLTLPYICQTQIQRTVTIMRWIDGDMVLTTDGSLNCNTIEGSSQFITTCKCPAENPIFDVCSDNIYRCYPYKEFCTDCIGRFATYDTLSGAFASYTNPAKFLEHVGISSTTHRTCMNSGFRGNIFIWNRNSWNTVSRNVFVKIKAINAFTNSRVEVSIASDNQFTGKLVLFVLWCPQSTTKTYHKMLLRMSGNINSIPVLLKSRETPVGSTKTTSKTITKGVSFIAPTKTTDSGNSGNPSNPGNSRISDNHVNTVMIAVPVVILIFIVAVVILVVVWYRLKKSKAKEASYNKRQESNIVVAPSAPQLSFNMHRSRTTPGNSHIRREDPLYEDIQPHNIAVINNTQSPHQEYEIQSNYDDVADCISTFPTTNLEGMLQGNVRLNIPPHMPTDDIHYNDLTERYNTRGYLDLFQ